MCNSGLPVECLWRNNDGEWRDGTLHTWCTGSIPRDFVVAMGVVEDVLTGSIRSVVVFDIRFRQCEDKA